MLRWMILTCVTLGCIVLAAADARATDQVPMPKLMPKPKRHASANLPPGLPHPHYKARTTIVYGAPPPPVVVAPDPDVLISFPSTPLLPGSSTLPSITTTKAPITAAVAISPTSSASPMRAE
jgi:hypothetical protein